MWQVQTSRRDTNQSQFHSPKCKENFKQNNCLLPLSSQSLVFPNAACEYKRRDKLHWVETVFRSEHVLGESRISRHCTAPRASSLHSQTPATYPYPQTDQSLPSLPFHLLNINCNIILPSTPIFSKRFLSLAFHHQNTVCSSLLPRTCYMPAHDISLDLITRMEFGKECRSWNSPTTFFSTPLLRHSSQSLVSSSVFALVRMCQRQDYKLLLCSLFIWHSDWVLTAFVTSSFL